MNISIVLTPIYIEFVRGVACIRTTYKSIENVGCKPTITNMPS